MRWWLLSVLLLWPGLSEAQEEKRVYPQQGVQTFLGLDDTSAPTQVQDGRAQDLQNVLLSVSRDLRQRYGVKLVGGTLDQGGSAFCAVEGLYYTKFSSGTERILALCDDRAYYLNGTTWTQILRQHPATITAGQNNQFVFTTALDNILFTNGVDAPLQWAGGTNDQFQKATFSGLTNAIQSAETVAFFKNYLIWANTKENGVSYPTRLRWSNVGTITTYTDADFLDISSLSGQEIVAVAELYDNLYVFFTDSIYKVSLVGGADTFQVSKVTDDIGCIAKNSVQSITLSNAQNGLVFLDKDKQLYFFNGVIAQDISQLITETMGALSGSRLQYAVSADTNTDYLLCLTSGSGTTNNLCLDLQYQIGEWTKHVNLNANAMAHVLDSNATDQVYFGTLQSLIYQYQDTNLRDDIGSATGTVQAVSRYSTSTASSLQVLYSTALNLTTGALVGAPIELVAGTGLGLMGTVADNTNTGLVVLSDFTTTPDTTTRFEVGAIDSFYTTKWYDFGDPARLKHWLEVYFWAEADVSSTHSLGWADDYSTDISTLSVSLSSSSSDAIWGSAIWGTALWGDVDDIFRANPISGDGRYFRLKWSEDDPQETFHVYGYSTIFRAGEMN